MSDTGQLSWFGRFRDPVQERNFLTGDLATIRHGLITAASLLSALFVICAFIGILILPRDQSMGLAAMGLGMAFGGWTTINLFRRADELDRLSELGFAFLFLFGVAVAIVRANHPSLALDTPIPVFLPIIIVGYWLVELGSPRLSAILGGSISLLILACWFWTRGQPLAVNVVVPGAVLMLIANLFGLFVQRRLCRLKRDSWLRLENERAAMRAQEESQRHMERLAQAKSEFVSVMSHELRTPLGGIQGVMDLLAATPLTSRQRQLVDMARGSAQALLGIVDGALDLAKMEAGQVSRRDEPVDMGTLITGVCQLLRPRATEKGLRLHALQSPALPGMVRTDPVLIRQILFNLVGNALKFTETGSVTVSVSPNAMDDGKLILRFEVTDTGIGIAPQAVGMLFHDFTQASPDISRHYGGSGLGLAICRRLAGILGGTIGVDSTLGLGSRFWVDIPCTGASRLAAFHGDDAPDGGTAAVTPHRPARILLAEDDPANQMVLTTILNRANHYLDLAPNGLDAVRQAAAGHYDLILMDVQMPGLDGIAATRAILAAHAPGTPRPRIIGLSANALGEDRLRCLQAGMDDHLTKPCDPAHLLAVVQQVMAEGTATDRLTP